MRLTALHSCSIVFASRGIQLKIGEIELRVLVQFGFEHLNLLFCLMLKWGGDLCLLA